MKRTIPVALVFFAVVAGLGWACSSDKDTDSGGGTGGSEAATGGGGGAGGETGGSATNGTGGSVAQGGTTGTSTLTGVGGAVVGTAACSNGIDDDKDGLVDGFDPECTGPLDNDESSFATGIPGDNRDPNWQDCFFDGNSGAGDDDCRYRTECLQPGGLPATDKDCTLTDACIKFCKPLTPNGCDCFGCCTVTLENGSTKDVLTGSGCSLDNINDAKVCPVCVKNTACGNTCGECELCIGKTEADLPDSCKLPPSDAGTPPPVYTCDGGAKVCSATQPCTGSEYCSLGCCITVMQ
jgi:hypothetical protein